MNSRLIFKPILALLFAFMALICIAPLVAAASAGASPNVAGISGVPGDFERDPIVMMDGYRVSAQRYRVEIDGIYYEAYCADPLLAGPENAGAVYELSGEAHPRLLNALRNGYPINSEWSSAPDIEERMWWAYVTRVAVAMANNPTRNFTGDGVAIDQARRLADGTMAADHAAYPPIMVNGAKDAQDTGRIVHGSVAQSEAFDVTYSRKTTRNYNPFRFEWAPGTPAGARLVVDGHLAATAPANPTTVFGDNIASFHIEMPNTAAFEGKTAAVNLVGIHNQFADRIWLMQNPNSPDTWQDIVFYIPEASASAAFSFRTEDGGPDEAELRIIKRDPSGKGLAGAVFEITGPGGYSERATSPSNGTIRLAGLAPGTYTVTEVEPPARHSLAEPASVTVTIAPGSAGVIERVFVNEPDAAATGVVIQKIDALTRENIPGALMRLRGISSHQVVTEDGQLWEIDNTGINLSQVLTAGATTAVPGDVTSTVTDGVWTLEGLPYGAYVVEEERAPNNYSILPQHTAYGFWLLPPNVSIKVNQGESEAVVDIQEAIDTMLEAAIAAAVAAGQPYPNIPALLQEIRQIIADMLDGATLNVVFDIEEDAPVNSILITFENYPFGSVEVTKYDEVTGNALAGAHFRIQGYFPEGNTNGMPIDRAGVTGSDGMVVFDNLPAGQYTVSEVEAPPGYQLDGTAFRSIPITWGQTASTAFYNRPKTFVEVVKVDGNDTGLLLDGARFRLSDPTSGETWEGVTEGGKARLGEGEGSHGNQLVEGKLYILTEIQAPNGYVLDASPIEVIVAADNQLNTVTVRNYRNPSLTIVKHDRETGHPLAGAVFSVIYENGQSVSGSPFTTDADGRIVLPWTLFEGNSERTLIVTEVEAPPGYILSDTNWQRVTMRHGEDNVVTFENLKKPTLTVIKYDELTNEPLAGATFRLWRTEGETWSESQVTGADGRIVWTDLDPGIYSVQEIDEPYGYFRDPDRKEVLLEAGDNKELAFFNRPRPVLTILKRDQVTGEPLPGVLFRVQRLEGGTIGDFLTDGDGMIELSPRTGYLLEERIYRVTEIHPPAEYLLSADSVRDALLKWHEPTELVFENLLKPTIVFLKTNGLTGRGISGAAYRVEYEASNGGIVNLGTYVTKCGLIVLPHVEPGWYILTETKAAPGYQLPTNPAQRVYLAPGQNSYGHGQTTAGLYFDPRTDPSSGAMGVCGDWCGYLCSRLCAGNCGDPGGGNTAGNNGGAFGNMTITNGNGDPLGGITNPPGPGTNPGTGPGTDPNAPTLTAGNVVRNSNLTATITFTSSAAGRYFYSVAAAGAPEPNVATGGAGTACAAGINTITVYMTAGARDVYIKVRDADGNVSGALKIRVPAFEEAPAPSSEPASDPASEPPPDFSNMTITGGTVVYLNPAFPGITITFGNP